MSVDYLQIAHENERNYGTEIDNYGPKLLADRYSEPTHFVFELLQNAEDALRERLECRERPNLPKAAKFHLFADRLEFRHFGIPFTDKHIRAICDIARSSKQHTNGAIGHFGIGFKSVYAFTRSPEIHSGDESFVIKSLVRPAPIEKRQTADGETLFVLPFDHSENSRESSYRAIADRLPELGSRTLLFLRQINEVEWSIEGGESGRYLRSSKAAVAGVEQMTVAVEARGKQPVEERWLVFSRAVGGEAGAAVGAVEIAYQLWRPKGKRAEQIRRVKDSPLCVYFATDLQTNLGFLVQGPFHLTQNRDNIRRKDKRNSFLAREVGRLVAESLSTIKDLGLLTVSALDAMPLDKEPFETETGELFLPVYHAVLEALRKKPLIPGVGKGFVRASEGVLMRGRKLDDLFKPDQLKSILNAEEERQWISHEITADRNATQQLHSYLINALGVPEISADSLAWRLEDSFLQSQKDRWFSRFYSFLLGHEGLWSESGGLRQNQIIRLSDGSNAMPFGSDGVANAFLPTNGEAGPKTVQSNCAKGEALNFLKRLGLRERDSVAVVLDDILPQYELLVAPAESKHARNLGRIFVALSQTESPDFPALVSKLKNTAFLRAVNGKTGERSLQKPLSLIYADTAELRDYFEGQDDCWFLAEPSIARKKLEQVVELGVGKLPKIRNTEVTMDRRWADIAPGEPSKRVKEYDDYKLHGLENLLKRIRKCSGTQPRRAARLSLLAWRMLTGVVKDVDFLRGRLKWNLPGKRPKEDVFDSQFVEQLRTPEWLPTRKGEFRKPSEMQERELPASFERSRLLCDALKFQTPRSEKLRQAGLRTNEIRWLELLERDPQTAAEILRNYGRRPAANLRADGGQASSLSPAGMTAATVPENLSQSADRDVTDPVLAPVRAEGEVEIAPQPGVGGTGVAYGEAESSREGREPRQARTDHLQTRVRVAPVGAIESMAENPEMSAERTRVDKAGVAKVKAFEAAAGRTVEELPHSHPGYDLHSRQTASGEIVRYIEVKSTGADWNGVMLSSTQFEAAQQLADRYWLYVVENADSAGAKVFPIRNPAGLSDKFVFDAGWKDVSLEQQITMGGPDSGTTVT